MILDDIFDEIDSTEDLSTVYFDYLEGQETEEGLYKAIKKICQYSFMVTADDVVACFYSGIQNGWTADEMLKEIFDFEGMMGYFDDEEVEADIYRESLTYFDETRNRVWEKFNKYLTNDVK